MDWLSIRENHDLLAYGIPGKHWEAVGEDHFETVSGTAYSFPGFVMTWRPALERLPTGIDPTMEEWFQRSKDPENFTPSPYIGFTFNAEPVLTELTQVQALNNELFPPIASGLVDPEEGLATLEERLNGAGYQKVLDEAEKQATEFLAKNE